MRRVSPGHGGRQQRGHRRNFAPVEEAAALFAAHEAGASRTRIRKSTGRKAEEIKTALAAGGWRKALHLPPDARVTCGPALQHELAGVDSYYLPWVNCLGGQGDEVPQGRGCAVSTWLHMEAGQG
jgi:hypothetical protein